MMKSAAGVVGRCCCCRPSNKQEAHKLSNKRHSFIIAVLLVWLKRDRLGSPLQNAANVLFTRRMHRKKIVNVVHPEAKTAKQSVAFQRRTLARKYVGDAAAAMSTHTHTRRHTLVCEWSIKGWPVIFLPPAVPPSLITSLIRSVGAEIWVDKQFGATCLMECGPL